MRSIALVFAALLSSPPIGDVTITAAPIADGTKFQLTSASDLGMTLTTKMAGQEVAKQELSAKHEVVCDVTVTAIDDKGVSAAKFAFGQCSQALPSPLGSKAADNDYANVTYDAKRGATGDQQGFLLADADQRSADENDAIRFVGVAVLERPLAAALVGKSLKPGEVVDVPADAAQRALLLFAADATVTSMKLTFTGERKEGAVDAVVFGVAATVTRHAEPLGETKMELAGEFVLAKSGAALLAATLDGPLSMNAGVDELDMKLELNLSGKAHWSCALTTK